MNDIALTREQSRALDRRAIDDYGISSLVLMENAGRGCVDVLERLGIDGPVTILCGKGNNAGDGFVIARHLDIRGYDCRVLLLEEPDELRGDGAANFAILKKTQVEIVELANQPGAGTPRLAGASRARAGTSSSPAELQQQLDQHAGDAIWIVDALLGTGAQGEPRPPYDAAIDWINARDKNTRVLAVDVPTGLDCDTGQPAKRTVRADHTCTFGAMKVVYPQPAAKTYTGTVHVCDIGVPRRLIEEVLNGSKS